MPLELTPAARRYTTVTALAGWFALIAQLYLILANRVVSVPETIVRYFSFYTILTNGLIAVSMTVLSFGGGRLYGFFSRLKVQAALTVYIIVVGAVYNVILRFLWEPRGLQLVVDELLHTVIPMMVVIFWLWRIPRGNLRWGDIPSWLWYPALYAVYVMLRGAVSGFYPYPFINVTELGYASVAVNVVLLVLFFCFVSVLIVFADRKGER